MGYDQIPFLYPHYLPWWKSTSRSLISQLGLPQRLWRLLWSKVARAWDITVLMEHSPWKNPSCSCTFPDTNRVNIGHEERDDPCIPQIRKMQLTTFWVRNSVEGFVHKTDDLSTLFVKAACGNKTQFGLVMWSKPKIFRFCILFGLGFPTQPFI